MSYKNNKFKISVPTENEEFQSTNGSYSVSDIQNYFEYIAKKHATATDNPSIIIYVNKIEIIIAFNVKIVSYLERLMPETMKLLGSTKRNITKG